MENLSAKSVLFFSPKFFDYEKEITSTLKSLGANVYWFDERPANDFFSKVTLRLNKGLLSKKIKKYYYTILGNIKREGQKIDYVFFLNPESITRPVLAYYRQEFKDARFLFYMWDSFKNRKKTAEIIPFFDAGFTFDPHDAKEYDLHFRPLFFTNVYKEIRSTPVLHDIVFIGTAHSDRYIFVKQIISKLEYKIKIHTYFYLSSKILFLAKKLIDNNFRGVKYKDIRFKPLAHQAIANLIRQSKCVLDINHPQQVGLTMRTFETLGCQCKIITTNADIKLYDFYNEQNILVINRDNPLINTDFLLKPFCQTSAGTLNKYSINGWVAEIFGLK